MRRMISDNQLNSLKAPDVIITGVPESAVQGTLTQEQIEMLLANDKSRIIFNNEYYYLNDKFHKNGVLTYTHSGYNESGIDKYLNITVTTRGWVLTETNISGGGGSEDFKIIKLNNNLTSSTLTQEQIDIIFPKDSSGNIYKPEYNILIYCTIYGIGVWYYLSTWTKNYVIFQLPGTDMSNKTFQLFPNKNKFEMFKQPLAAYQHNIYIKTNDLYIFLTIFGDDYTNFTSITDSYLLDQLSAHVACSGYISGAGLNAPITALRYNAPDSTFYFSAGENGKDYAIFTANDVIEFTDEGKPFKIL